VLGHAIPQHATAMRAHVGVCARPGDPAQPRGGLVRPLIVGTPVSEALQHLGVLGAYAAAAWLLAVHWPGAGWAP
jgi:hypothetical protein